MHGFKNHPTHLRNPNAKRTTSSAIPEETCTFDSKIPKHWKIEEPREPSPKKSKNQENHHPTHLRNPSAKRTTSSTIPEETCTFDSKIKNIGKSKNHENHGNHHPKANMHTDSKIKKWKIEEPREPREPSPSTSKKSKNGTKTSPWKFQIVLKLCTRLPGHAILVACRFSRLFRTRRVESPDPVGRVQSPPKCGVCRKKR